MAGTILLAAGGTGGHLFPAHALASELARRGWDVDLATDERAERYGARFPARTIHIISSATIGGASPVALARAAFLIGKGIAQSIKLILALKPKVVVGFGGYPTLPPLFAAAFRGIPVVLHEQNAVVGRANRLMIARATAIATSFDKVDHLGDGAGRAVRTGNPVRDHIVEVARVPYVAPEADGTFRLLVFGGSQGARFFSDVVPAALAKLDERTRARFRVSQQCRAEDLARVRDAYDRIGVEADLGSFFVDMAERLSEANLVIGRAGASTVAELGVVGRPSILVPYPHALDHDQKVNAEALANCGAALVVDQTGLTAARLAGELSRFIGEPARLQKMAAAARLAGRPDAVSRLADLVERVARGEMPKVGRSAKAGKQGGADA